MNILLLQAGIVWNSPEANYSHLDGLLRGESKADMIILPEMFATGFAVDPRSSSVNGAGTTLEWMRKIATRYDAAVVGSVAVEERGKFFNRCYFVMPDGSCEFYDKRHLFGFAGEDKDYSPGDRRVVVEWRGVRILLQVCYDLRFPVFSRNVGDYDMAVYVANWPQSRRQAWDTLLRARAIENVCYVAGVNRVGDDPEYIYDGGSALLDFKGDTVAQADNGRQQCVTAKIDMDLLRDFRMKFPALDDADAFELKN